jgi:RNA polymerase sigma factor for flagellar operon FliA
VTVPIYTHQGRLDRKTAAERYGALVRRVASQMIARLPANVEIDDLVQAGMIGLFDALSRFQASNGVQFETFATQRIRGAMLDELRGTDWLPRSVRKNQRDIDAAIHRLEQRLKRAPSESEIASEMKLSLQDYQSLLADARGAQLIHIDEISEKTGDDEFLDRNMPRPEANPVDRLHDDRFRAALIQAIGDLPEKEQQMMSMYYERGMNLKEIGAVFGVTESRISQMHSQAISRIRSKLRPWI